MTAYTTTTTRTAGQSLNATMWNAVANNDTHFSEVLAWTPTVTQGTNVAKTTVEGWYGMAGKRVFAGCDLTVTGSGTGTNAIFLSLPVTAAASQASTGLAVIGSGWIIDNSASRGYLGAVLCTSTTTCALRRDNQTANIGLAQTDVATFALASPDRITFTIQYRAA